MAYSYCLNYQQNLITGQRSGSGIFRGRNKLRGKSTKMCYDFTINDSGELTPNDVPLMAIKQREQAWLFGPATRLATRSIIYPCSKGRCSLPCPCLLCHNKQHPRCRVASDKSCVCQDCKEHFANHESYHSVFHYGCKQCHQIVKIIPNCNFTILNLNQNQRFLRGGHLPEVSMCARNKERIILDEAMEWCPVLGCSKSDKLSPSHDSLKNHLLEKHSVSKLFFHHFIENDKEVSPLQCTHCVKTFATRYELERHIESVHLKTTFECSYCDQVFSRKDNYENHKLNHHEDSNHSCLTCKKKFKTRRALLWHLEFGIWCRLQCVVCTKSFTRKQDLVKHEKACNTLAGGSGGVCGVCLETFQFDIDLQRHRKSASNPDGSCKFVCFYCNENKCSLEQVRKHIDDDHFGPNRDEEAEKVYAEKRLKRKLVWTHDDVFQCEKCEEMFPSRESLRKHLDDHTDETSGSTLLKKAESFECKCCASKFKFKKNFERHSREALNKDGNPKHVCNKCDKEFCTGKILKVHLKFSHQPFSCSVCGQCFTTKQTLERHVKKAVSITCSICDQVFCNKQAYDFHMSKVHLNIA